MTFGFPLMGRLAVLAAVLAATVLLAWPLVSSLWTSPGKQGPDVLLALPPGWPTTTTTQPRCRDIEGLHFVDFGGRCVATCSIGHGCPWIEYQP
jgi:hypothetical protein